MHQSKQRQTLFDKELEALVKQADILKAAHPGCGVEKMYYTLKPNTMGRDKFCEIFLSLGYGSKPVKNYRKTTIASHINYPNLIEGMQVVRPCQVIQSDITYFDIGSRFYYLIFIVDVYTREILGYRASNHMRAEANLKALNMALSHMNFAPATLIHHSDRGSQYGSDIYRNRLKEKGIHISMGLVATDNAYAERVNGIIKNEYLKKWNIKTEHELKLKIKKAVNHYNQSRKHRAHQMKYSPSEFRNIWLGLTHRQLSKVTIYTQGREPNSHSLSRKLIEKTDLETFSCSMEI